VPKLAVRDARSAPGVTRRSRPHARGRCALRSREPDPSLTFGWLVDPTQRRRSLEARSAFSEGSQHPARVERHGREWWAWTGTLVTPIFICAIRSCRGFIRMSQHEL